MIQDFIADDVTGPPGSGKVVQPNLQVPDGGSDLKSWMSKPDASMADINFLVDRDKQPWWPTNSGMSGYQGRWGPWVEHDPFSKRSGIIPDVLANILPRPCQRQDSRLQRT